VITARLSAEVIELEGRESKGYRIAYKATKAITELTTELINVAIVAEKERLSSDQLIYGSGIIYIAFKELN
jgi:hypothetical protein